MRNYKYLLLVSFVSTLPLLSFFTTTGLIHTHDGLVHIPRIAAYYKALKDGQIPVRWAGDLNYGYGMPLFNFMYQIPYVFASFFVMLGLGLVNSFKITLSISFLLSGIFMFLFARSVFLDDKKAFLVTIFYQFFSFRIIEVLIRGSFGEVYTYTFLPLVLYGIVSCLKKQQFKYFFITALATALLVLSHNAVSLVFFLVCLLYLVFFSPNKKSFIFVLISLGYGLILSAFYFVPAILEHKYTYGDLFMKNLYTSYFPPFQNFFIPNFFNSKMFQTGGISVQLGIFHILAVLTSIYILFRKKINSHEKRIIFFCVLLFATSLYFMHPLSLFFWRNIAFLRQFQFPWRFLSVCALATSLLASFLLDFKFFRRPRVYVVVIILVIISSLYYWIPQNGFDKINENYFWNFPLNTTYFGETDVVWSAGPAQEFPKKRMEVISGNGTISNFRRKSNLHIFTVSSNTNLSVVDHTQYFPGWRVLVDNKSVPTQFQDPSYRGQIIFNIPKGRHDIQVIFGESKIRFISDIISLGGIMGLIILSLRKAYEKK